METKTIYTKLLEFQKLGITILKDGKNEYFKNTKGQPSKYCTLNEVLEKVKKPLNEMGIVIIFEPTETGLKTILHDTENNTEVSGFMKYVDCGNAQKLLACNTYFRRGSLVSMLGLEDEDDDGNKASQTTKETEPNPYQAWIDEFEKINRIEDLEAYYKQNEATIKGNKELVAMVKFYKAKFTPPAQ
jgi:hypothetical protein